ncbi:MAG: AmmeMemoRadiSam system protein B [Patescibacteria group bacterium]|jgi:AmmeMemoRadiSam system protein B
MKRLILSGVFCAAFLLGIGVAWMQWRSVEDDAIPVVEPFTYMSPWVPYDAYETLYRTQVQETTPVATYVPAAIVNHHLLASDLITKTLAALSTQHPSVIVLLAPDHFSKSTTPLSTSLFSWHTEVGDLSVATVLAERLAEDDALSINPNALDHEHGIGNITTFLANVFPGTPFIPVIVSEHASVAAMDEFAQRLDLLLPVDALVLGSFDFSHGKTLVVQQENDAVSTEVLGRLAAEETSELDVDSRNGLRMLLQFARFRNAGIFAPIGHSSSAARMNDPETTENTSYITGYFTAAP